MRASRPRSLVYIAVLLAAVGVGLAVGLLWPDDDDTTERASLPATERCLTWLSDLHAGAAALTEEQRHQVRTLVRPGALATEEEALFQLWAIGRRESCARAARFGFVGSDGSLGPGAIAILDRCLFVHTLKEVEPDAAVAKRIAQQCRRIDEAVGRDPNDFG